MFNPYILFIFSVIWYMAVRNGVTPDSLDRDAYIRFTVLAGPIGWFFALIKGVKHMIIHGPEIANFEEERPHPTRRRTYRRRTRRKIDPDEKYRI